MNKEKLEEALKVIKEPITVNSIEYKYFDIENYNKLVNAIDYCNYLNANVKPYVEAQDKEIERLNNEIKTLLKENSNKEKVIIKQNNIIDELEKWLKEQYEFIDTISEFPTIKEIQQEHLIMLNDYENVLNKLKELKEGDING